MKQKQMWVVIVLCSISMLILAGCQAKKRVTQTEVKYKTQITSIDSYGNVIIGAIEKEKTALQVGDTLTVSFGDNGGSTEQLTCCTCYNHYFSFKIKQFVKVVILILHVSSKSRECFRCLMESIKPSFSL